MSRDFLPGELDEVGERLKIEFGIDRLILTPRDRRAAVATPRS